MKLNSNELIAAFKSNLWLFVLVFGSLALFQMFPLLENGLKLIPQVIETGNMPNAVLVTCTAALVWHTLMNKLYFLSLALKLDEIEKKIEGLIK